MHARVSQTFVFILLVGGMTAASLGAGPHDADARLQALYTTEWKWREQQLADGEDSQRPIEDHLPKADPAAQEMRLHYWEDVHRKLDAIDRAQLSLKEQINYDVYRPQIEVLIANQRFRDLRDAGQLGLDLLDRSGIYRAPQLPQERGVHELAWPAARCAALFPRADGRDACGCRARFHAAGCHDGGA